MANLFICFWDSEAYPDEFIENEHRMYNVGHDIKRISVVHKMLLRKRR